MDKTLILAFVLLTLNLNGQIKVDSLNGGGISESLSGIKIGKRTIYTTSDTIPVVVNLKDSKATSNILWYLNGQVVEEQVLNTIDSKRIEEMNVEKRSVELNGRHYEGIIYVTTMESYNPRLITLNELKTKYLDVINELPTLFLIDGAVINEDYDTYLVDEKYILKIDYQIVNNSKENLNTVVVTLIMRTKQNLDEANTIRIKGVDSHGINENIDY